MAPGWSKRALKEPLEGPKEPQEGPERRLPGFQKHAIMPHLFGRWPPIWPLETPEGSSRGPKGAPRGLRTSQQATIVAGRSISRDELGRRRKWTVGKSLETA